jgi:uncharacterized membrane protein (UPF0127 family)
MIKQLFLPLAAVAAFIILVGVYTQKPSILNFNKAVPTASPQQKTVTIGNKSILVEVASTESARKKGLGGRSSLSQDSGMLFVFDLKDANPTFWMKDMLIPLDFIWIKGTKIVKIDKNVPIPAANTPDSKLDKIRPNQPVDYVLEVNGGFSDANSLKVGDSVTLPTL